MLALARDLQDLVQTTTKTGKDVASVEIVVGSQYEDDLNTLTLGGFTVVDLQLSRPITKWGEVFLSVENLFNETYGVARTSDGIVSIGGPRQIRAGVRLSY